MILETRYLQFPQPTLVGNEQVVQRSDGEDPNRCQIPAVASEARFRRGIKCSREGRQVEGRERQGTQERDRICSFVRLRITHRSLDIMQITSTPEDTTVICANPVHYSRRTLKHCR